MARNVGGQAGMHENSTALRRPATRRGIAFGATLAAVVAVSMAGFTPPATAAGLTWYVDQAAGADGPDCGAAAGADACATIGAALARVTPDDVVAIAPGAYAETLVLNTPVSLQGASPADVVLTGVDPEQPVITVDAGGAVAIADVTIRPSISSESAATSAVHVAQDRSATLLGITVSGTPGVPSSSAGVVADAGSTVTIEGSTFTGLALGVAAGDLLGGSTTAANVSISSSTFTGNSAGVGASAGVVTITGGSISDSLGAGVMSFGPGSVFDVTGTSITGNGEPAAGTYRGGVVLYGGTFTGTDVTISGNANGIMADGGRVELTNSTVTDNLGEGEGVGIFARPGDVGGGTTIPAIVSITGTMVSGSAKGLAVETAVTTVIASTISDNTLGIQSRSTEARGSLELIDSVVTGNDGEAAPGVTPAGVSIEGPTDVIVTNTEISANLIGLLVGPDSQVTMTGGAVSDNGWVGIFALEQPHSGTVLTVDLTGTSITGNGLAAGAGAAYGFGGIAARFQAAITGSDVTISGNAAGVSAQGGTLSLTDSRVIDNVITSLDQLAGFPITGNGIIAGAAGQEWQTDVELLRTEVSGNARDGVLAAPSTAIRVITSTIAGNGGVGVSKGGPGDPLELPDRPILLAGSTIAQNAEGALNLGGGAGLTAIGSIVQAPDGTPACLGEVIGLIDGGANVFSDETCAAGATSTVIGDPLLDALADNGGPTLTAMPTLASPAVGLVPVGTAIGWGLDSIELCPGTTDQRGTAFPRLLGDACDAGAVERTPGGLITVTASDATTYEGAFEPEITAGYAGFVEGDTAADLDTLPTCSYDLETATTFCSGAVDDFYTFEYVNGTLTVLDPLVIVTETLPDATVGQLYSVTLEAIGGDGGPYTWGIDQGALPAGLQLDTATGEISGTPEVAGDVTFTVFVGDPILKEFTLSVAEAPVEPTEPPTTSEPTDPPTTEPTDEPSTSEPTDEPTNAAPAPTGGSGDTGGDLPDTGADGLTTIALSAAIALLGGAILLIARRHRQQRA